MDPKNKNLNWFFIFLFLFLTIGFVNAYDVTITFYDESTLSVIPEVTITDANGSTYTSDINGLWQTQLTGAKDLTISKTGYGSRKLQFNFTEDTNFDFALNPTGLDSSIGFIVKDSNNNLWTNKYLQFKNNNLNINWTQRTSSFDTTNILSVAYGNDVWVTVGDNGKLATATDPTGTWTQRTSSFDAITIWSVAYGNNVWVAVGTNGKLATATDPTGTWTQRTSSFGTTTIRSVAYGNGVWVAVGDYGKLATATDPTGTWTQRTSSFDATTIRSVAYGNGVWVAVGDYGKLATATDPTGTWTQRTSSFDTTNILSVAYGNGVWITVGYSGKLATATDPTGTWTQRTSSFSSTAILSVAYSNGVWVAVGSSGKLATATDPTGTWTQRTSSFDTSSIYSVTYGNGTWVAVGSSGKLATSPIFSEIINSLIINSLLTSSSGTATANISSTGDYNALLYTADGNLTHTYTKTNVTVNKPKEEINPSNSVSPYDITVNGLLEYSLTNQTASSVDISIFAGAVGNYIFTVADYNANPLDRQYLERSYIAKAPMGSDYVSSILYQPYLIGVTDVIVPRIYVLDQLTRTIQDAEIYISTNINFTETIVESGLTDGAGVFMFSAIPLKNYYVSVYYEGVFKGTYLIKPRTSDDIFFITVDRTAYVDIAQTLMINIDFTDTVKQQSYDENLSIKAEITSNYDYLTGYNLKVYQGNTLKFDANFSGSGSSITIDKEVDMNLFQKFQDVRAVVTAKYTIGGVAGTESASQRISIFASNNRFTYFTKMREEVGQPLAILLSIILTAMVVAIITFSGLPISPAVTGVLGILVLGIFAFMGWLDLGVIAFGVDIGKILYILLVGVALYFTIRIGGV